MSTSQKHPDAPSASPEKSTSTPVVTNDGDMANFKDGLTMLNPFDVNTVGPKADYTVDTMTDNYTGRTQPYDQTKSVSSKGKSFDIDP